MMVNFNTTYKQEIVFVRILVPFVLGIISFYGYKSSWIQGYLIVINVMLFAYLHLQYTFLKRQNNLAQKGINGLIFHLLIFFTGYLCSELYKQHNNSDYYAFKKSEYLKITISTEPINKQNIILLTANVTQSVYKKQALNNQKDSYYKFSPVSGKIKVTILKDTSNTMIFKYGEELIIPSKFTETSAPVNPLEFDLRSWLAMQNIYHETFLRQNEISKLKKTPDNGLVQFAIQLREKQVAIYRRLIKDDDAFAVAATLILGYRTDLSPQILNIYSKTGTIHALSVSGMHVGLVYLILNHTLWFLNRKKSLRFIKIILICFVIWFYTLFTGFSPSVLRASIMISVFIISKLFTKSTNSYNVIAFTAFCLLLYNPFFIWDIGFQLSFIAVLGLIYLQPKIQNCLTVRQPILSQVWSITAMSTAAQLATYPLSVYYFHQFPLYFLISNLFITLPAALIMYLGIIILIFRLDSLGPIFEWLIIFINSGLDKIARLPFSGINAIWISQMELMLLFSSLLLLIIALDKLKKQLFIVSFVLFLCLQSSISYHKMQAFHQKKIIKFTLKKNYAVVAISSYKAILYTDLIPESKTFNYSIKPALDQHRITQVTFVEANVTDDLKDYLIFD